MRFGSPTSSATSRPALRSLTTLGAITQCERGEYFLIFLQPIFLKVEFAWDTVVL